MRLGFSGWIPAARWHRIPQRDHIREAARAVRLMDLGPFARVALALDMLRAAQ